MDELVSRRYLFGPTSPNLMSMRPRRLVSLLTGLALVLAACGGGASEPATPAESISAGANGDTAPATEPVPDSGTAVTAAPTEATTGPRTERPAPDPNREIAPDFDLLLGDGSTFVLSEETRPVFMVFWAEW